MVTEAWQKILDMQKAGQLVTSKIETVNRGGVIITVEGVQGFIPMSRLDPSRLTDMSVDAAGSEDQAQVSLDEPKRSAMVGQEIKAKIIQVNVPERLLVLSERAANMADLLRTVKRGDVVEGTVQKLTDYGAFVSITAADGTQHGTDALIHKSELSWDRVMRPEQVVRPGDKVQCKVTSVDQEKARVQLSLKRMQSDPLKETLDGVLPLVEEGAEALGTVPTSVPQSIEEVASELEKEEGISGITMGRQVEERRTVAQDLEIYIGKKKVEDGYALVARAGRVVQEVVVKTELDPAGLRAAMQRALKRLV